MYDCKPAHSKGALSAACGGKVEIDASSSSSPSPVDSVSSFDYEGLRIKSSPRSPRSIVGNRREGISPAFSPSSRQSFPVRGVDCVECRDT